VVTRISSHRELLPEHLVDKVDFGDVEEAARLAADIIRQRRRTSPQTMAYLHRHYSLQTQLEQYATAILKARPAEALGYRFMLLSERTCFNLPVWCYRTERGIYHDFRADYQVCSELMALLNSYPHGFTQAEAGEQGVARDQVMAWYRDGYLYPTPD
jgi:hypothetical protein